MAISAKTLERCHKAITSEWQSTRSIMVQLEVGREHTIKMLNVLRRDRLIKKKQPPHNFNTCNKKNALWKRVST